MLLLQPLVACSADPAPQKDVTNTTKASVPSQIATDERLVVAFGDSLFAGYNLGLGEGFAPMLERALNKAGVKAKVINAGVSGDTSAAGLARLAFTLDGLPRKPDLMVLSLGGNDMLRGLNPAETRRNLDAILADLKARGIPAVLTGMVAAPNMGRDYAAAFNPIYPELAKTYAIPLYPFLLDGVLGHRALQLPDGIHPNPKGVAVMVAGVGPLVEKALKP